MPSKRTADRFKDIIYNIDATRRYTAGMTEKQFLADEKTFDATQLCLLRISEAAKRLGALAKDLAPDQPWADIRGVGNRLRHVYDTIDRHQIWRIVEDDLIPLRADCERATQQIRKGLDRKPAKARKKQKLRSVVAFALSR